MPTSTPVHSPVVAPAQTPAPTSPTAVTPSRSREQGTRDGVADQTPEPARSLILECLPEELFSNLLELGIIENQEDLRAAAPLGDSPYVPEFCSPRDIFQTSDDEPRVYQDRIFVLPVTGDLITDPPAYSQKLVERFYEYFEDDFDFLFFVQGLYQFEYPKIIRSDYSADLINPSFLSARNYVFGIGIPISEPSQLRSSEQLQGEIWLPSYANMARPGTLLHEIMHRWANYIFPSPSYSHWAFLSANGMVGGFDLADLVDLGEGRYAVRNF